MLAHDTSGRCLFLRPDRTCAIHGQLGHDALPVSCRLFPRVCLLAPRGVSITLSHFCPTAAALLFGGDAPVRLLADAPAFPEGAHYEGLDARRAPPPLLRPGVWMGWDGHERWERHVLDSLSRPVSAEAALERLAAQAEEARRWTVRDGPFLEHLERVLSAAPAVRAPRPADGALRADVLAAVPEALRPVAPDPPLDVSWGAFHAPLRRYLAARAFASWVAIQGPGLRTAVRALQAALSVVRHEAARLCLESHRPLDEALLKEAFRRADLLLVHLASPEALARELGRCERDPPGRP